MKKTLLSLFAAFSCMFTYAQNTVQIVDGEGNDVSDKTITVVAETIVDEFTEVATLVADGGLKIKNISDNITYCKVASYNIKEITNGSHQLCYVECIQKSRAGNYQYAENTNPSSIKAGAEKLMRAEWFPAEGATEGKCVVEYKTEIYSYSDGKYTFVEDGPTVTVNYVLGATAIDGVAAGEEVSVTYYDMLGCKVSSPKAGVYIKRAVMADGTVVCRKVCVK